MPTRTLSSALFAAATATAALIAPPFAAADHHLAGEGSSEGSAGGAAEAPAEVPAPELSAVSVEEVGAATFVGIAMTTTYAEMGENVTGAIDRLLAEGHAVPGVEAEVFFLYDSMSEDLTQPFELFISAPFEGDTDAVELPDGFSMKSFEATTVAQVTMTGHVYAMDQAYGALFGGVPEGMQPTGMHAEWYREWHGEESTENVTVVYLELEAVPAEG